MSNNVIWLRAWHPSLTISLPIAGLSTSATYATSSSSSPALSHFFTSTAWCTAASIPLSSFLIARNGINDVCIHHRPQNREHLPRPQRAGHPHRLCARNDVLGPAHGARQCAIQPCPRAATPRSYGDKCISGRTVPRRAGRRVGPRCRAAHARVQSRTV